MSDPTYPAPTSPADLHRTRQVVVGPPVSTRRSWGEVLPALLAAIAAAGLLATACGSDDGTVRAPDAAHSQADVTFVQGMIPHHEQAVTMSELADSRASNPRVKDLAKRIVAAQGPEISQMKGLLKDWGVEEQGGDMGGMAGMGGMGEGHPGMLADADLDKLRAAKGQEFDRLFLQGMIAHHQGAIVASEKEQAEGQSPEAKALAGEIIKMQRAEIAEMEPLLAAT